MKLTPDTWTVIIAIAFIVAIPSAVAISVHRRDRRDRNRGGRR